LFAYYDGIAISQMPGSRDEQIWYGGRRMPHDNGATPEFFVLCLAKGRAKMNLFFRPSIGGEGGTRLYSTTVVPSMHTWR
jgi:hypothetical protein